MTTPALLLLLFSDLSSTLIVQSELLPPGHWTAFDENRNVVQIGGPNMVLTVRKNARVAKIAAGAEVFAFLQGRAA